MLPHASDEQLEDFILGQAGPAERAGLEAHLAACPTCAQHRTALEATFADLALALPPAKAGPGLRSRLFASVDHLERFTPMAPRLAELLDIPANDARRALHAFERPEALPSTPVPGMKAAPLPTGPRRREAEAVLACLTPGTRLPRHKHLGGEVVLVFQGAFITDDGREVHAGQELQSLDGSVHAIALVLGDEPCLCAIVNERGMERVR